MPGFAAKLKLWVAATRPFSFPCSMVPVLIATAAVAPVSRWRWDVFVLTLAAVLCLHIAANLLNDYFDYTAGVDTRVEEEGERPGRMLVTGAVTPRGVLRGAWLALAAAALMCVYLTWRTGPLVPLFGAFAFVGLYYYTAPPLKLKARGLGEVMMVIWFGPALVAGVAYVQIDAFPLPVMLMSVPIGFLTTAILVGNNLRDLEEDAAGGVRTLAQRIGPRAAAWLYVFLVVGAPAGITLVGLAYGVPLLGLTLLSLLAVVGPVRAVIGGRRLPDIDARTARLPLSVGAIATTVLICVGGI
jgi:1,4-dihydroxy-2-naphthoate octaprenyltransferase